MRQNTVQILLVTLAVAAALVFVPHRVGNLVLRLIVKTATGVEYLIDRESPLSPQYRAVRRVLLSARQPVTGSMAEQIAHLRWGSDHFLRAFVPIDPNVAAEWKTAEFAGAADVPVLWVNTSNNASAPTVLHFHPGGYFLGANGAWVGAVAAIGARTGSDIASVEYRMAPEHSLTATVDDAVTAYRWLLGRKPAHDIVLMGESAGGGLVLLLLGRIQTPGLPLPAGAVLGSPAVDLTGASFAPEDGQDPMLPPEIIPLCLEIHKKEASAFSPLSFPTSSFVGFPPLHIVSGSAEALLPGIDQMCQKLVEASVNVTCKVGTQLPHAYSLLHDWFPEAESAVVEIVRFVKFALARH